MENGILTISSRIEEATTFIEEIGVKGSISWEEEEKSEVPLNVPWMIENKYYVADVHFSVWTVDRVNVELLERQAPALVFVWTEGEEYVKHVEELARMMKLGEYEPEVALAVRIRGGCSGEVDENGDIDRMLMSFGFEYVDGTGLVEDDIPGLPRVVDALSTIMWPSMRLNKREEDEGDDEEIFGDMEETFGVLEEYKLAIAGMDDEEEKRKCAAKVAYALVYG